MNSNENLNEQRQYILSYIDYLKRIYGIRIVNERNLNIWRKKYKQYHNKKIKYLNKDFELKSDDVKNKLALNLKDKLEVVYDPRKRKDKDKCKVQYCVLNKMENFNVCEYHKCKVPSCPFVKHCREFEYDNIVYNDVRYRGVEETKGEEEEKETKEEEPVLKQNIKDIFNVQGVKFGQSSLLKQLSTSEFITNLNISNQYISEINVEKNTTIKVLNISNNYFNTKSFTKVVETFKNLERLNASNNIIDKVVDLEFNTIIDLNLSNNKITKFRFNFNKTWKDSITNIYTTLSNFISSKDTKETVYLYINFDLSNNLIDKLDTTIPKDNWFSNSNYIFSFDYSNNKISKLNNDLLENSAAYKFYNNNLKDNKIWLVHLDRVYNYYYYLNSGEGKPTFLGYLLNPFRFFVDTVKGLYNTLKFWQVEQEIIIKNKNLRRFMNFIKSHNVSSNKTIEPKDNFMVNYNTKFKLNTNESSVKTIKIETGETENFPFCIRHVKLAYKDERLNELYFDGNNLKFTTHRDIFINDMEDLYKSNIILAYFTQLEYIEEDTLKLKQLKLKPWFLENKDVINKYVLSFIQ